MKKRICLAALAVLTWALTPVSLVAQQTVSNVPIAHIQPFDPTYPITQYYCSTQQLSLGTHLVEFQPASNLAWNDPNRSPHVPLSYVDCNGQIQSTTLPTQNLVAAQTLSTAAPVTTRPVQGTVTLNYQGSVNIAANGSAAGVRGVDYLSPGTTLVTGFLYGTEGKVYVQGTLNNGSGFTAGIFGQIDTSSATATHTTGYLAPIMGDFGATSNLATDANANMITVLNTTQCTIHAVQTSIVKASYWQDIQEINANNFLAATSGSVTNVGTKGWIKISITPNGGSTVTRYIALGDGVT